MPLNFGDLDPTAIYVGDRAVSKVYVGSQQVWPAEDPGGGPLFQGEWPGAGGDPWPADWAITSSAVTVDQDGSGGGRFNLFNTVAAHAVASPVGVSVEDVDILANVTAPAENLQWVRLYARWDGSVLSNGEPNIGYGFSWRPATTSNSLFATRYEAGPITTVQYVGGGSTSGRWWLRAQVEGSTLRFRRWAHGDPEPSTWEVEVVDTSPVSGPGLVAIANTRNSGNPAAATVHHFEVTAL